MRAMTRILTIAHRGGAGLWPENTMAAFERALAMGCEGIELDCHLTREGTLVVYHDEALNGDITRGPDGRWLAGTGPLIKALTFEELQGFDVGRARPGSPYDAAHPHLTPVDGERIPSLRSVIRLAKQASATARLWIELKTALMAPELSSTPQQMADAVLDLLIAEDFLERAVLIAFDWTGLIHAKRREMRVETRFTTLPQSWFGPPPIPPGHWPPPPKALESLRRAAAEGAPWEGGFHPKDHGGLLPAIAAAGANGWFPFHPDLQPESAAEARRLRLSLAAWTVDEPEDMRRLAALGVDAICTDRPDLLAALAL
ncbi:MAG: glycerophosphodiester phosphodiesterase [Alphaproteobacteria bacterium]|nr:glycerophosphodiester phosphodiesterase [Alphaproteobacteria bacterium]